MRISLSDGQGKMSEFFQKWWQGSFVFARDLNLLASLYFAKFIVWRVLRRTHKDNAARRKRFKLLSGSSCNYHAQSHTGNRIYWPREVVSNARPVHWEGNERD